MATSSYCRYSPLLLIPQTQHLTLSIYPDHITTICLLTEDLAYYSPHLKSFCLPQTCKWPQVTTDIFAPYLSRLLSSLQHLEEFSCDWLPLSNETVVSLLQLPNLRKMVVHKDITALEQILSDQELNEPHFEEVAIWTDHLGACSLAGLLISLQPTSLTSFQVSTTLGWCSQADLGSLLHAIGESCSPTQFAELVLTTSALTIPTITVKFAMLGSLLSFTHLRVLIINHHCFDLTDEEIKTMAMAWPNLTKWEYEVNKEAPEARTTMRGLLWLAIFCRKLESLTFKFSGMCEVLPDEMALAANHGLTTLDLGESVIENAEEMAIFLDTVFTKRWWVKRRGLWSR